MFKNLPRVREAEYDTGTTGLRRACTEHTRTEILKELKERLFVGHVDAGEQIILADQSFPFAGEQYILLGKEILVFSPWTSEG